MTLKKIYCFLLLIGFCSNINGQIYVSNDEEKKNIHKNFKIKLEDIIVNK